MIEIPVELPPELVPLSWLLGVWEGTGVIDYQMGERGSVAPVQHEFGQRLSFSHDGFPFLNYSSFTWLLDENRTPLVSEIGYWRVSRAMTPADPGPGMLPGLGAVAFPDAGAVETLRNDDGGFDLQVALVHPVGVNELYLGQIKGPRIDLTTDVVLRAEGTKEYSGATRMYGLVENHLLWAWDMAALGQDLRTHASGRLARVE